jgi:hypothetical protein
MAVSPTRPKPYAQGDGSWAQWLNCVLACATDLMCRATVGYWRVAASRLRTISGDTQGGVTYNQAADVTRTATKGEVILEARYGLSRSQVKALVNAGRAVAISISCAVTRYTSRRTNTFIGGHSVYINDYEWRTTTCYCEKRRPGLDHAEYLIDDPGTTSVGYLWWSADLVYRAAEARTGVGQIACLVARDTEGVWRKARTKVTIRSSPSISAKAIGTFAQGQSAFTSKTLEGGDWVADTDGHLRNDWYRVKFGDSKYGFVKGESLR